MTDEAADPIFGEWFVTPRGYKFLITTAYLRGAYDAQCAGRLAYKNPYAPGEELAQYNYGFANEKLGEHDNVDLPFERMKNG
jgi:hypothetical protein